MKPFILLSIVVAISDQFTKQMIVRTLDQCGFGFCDSIDLLPFLKLVLLYNDGAAFSILSDAGGWQRWFLSIVSFAVSCFIFFWILRLKPSEHLLGFAFAIILGVPLEILSTGFCSDMLLISFCYIMQTSFSDIQRSRYCYICWGNFTDH